MKTLLKTLLLMAVVVLLLAAGLMALVLQPMETSTEGVAFVAAEPVDISSVEVENQTGAYRYFYEGDGYVLDDIPATIADIDGFIDFMTACGQLSAIRRVADASLETYGLQTPAATVRLDFFNGSPITLRIGNQEKISGCYYVTADGFPGVYLMEEAQVAPFFRPKTQVVAMLVTPPLQVSSPLSAIRDITFVGGLLEQPVTIQATAGGSQTVRQNALSFGTATHLVRSAGLYQLDQSYGVEIFTSLFGIQALDVAAYNATPDQFKAMGFDRPWMTVEYDMINGAGMEAQHCVLWLVRLEDGAFYASLEGTGAVYRIGRQAFMDIRLDKLLLRWFLTPMLMDVAAVSVEGEGQRYRYDIDNTDSKNPVITCEGKRLDPEGFRSFYRLITSAAHDGAYLGNQTQPEGEALLTITYEYRDQGKPPDVLALYPGQVRRANVFVNGAGEFAMKDQFISRVLEGCQHLLAGQPVEENW